MDGFGEHSSTRTEVRPHFSLSPEVASVLDEVVATRREIHMYPEKGYQETRTAALVADRLRSLGIDPRTGVAETGVVGLIEGGKSGPIVMLRADIDALPVQELSDTPYRSRVPHMMHACGHDGHTAALLGAARVLCARRHELHGCVKLVFQPAEESLGGAKRMIEEGVLEDPPVAVAFGFHLWNSLPLATVGVVDGPAMASTDYFQIFVRGKGGHAAAPHETVDPIIASAYFLVAAQSIISRSRDPLQPAVFTVGSIHGGSAGNVIPDEVELTGTLRTLCSQTRSSLVARVEEVLRGTLAAHGASCSFVHHPGYPVLVNHPALCRVAREEAAAVVGNDGVCAPAPTMGGEDMAYYLERVPGCYVWIGSAPGEGPVYPHHNARFDFDERALGIATELLVRLARRALSAGGCLSLE